MSLKYKSRLENFDGMTIAKNFGNFSSCDRAKPSTSAIRSGLSVLTFILLIFPLFSFGQVKIFKTYDDYSKGAFDSYKQIRKADLSNNFIVKDASNKKTRISRTSIWGYQDEKDNLYRVWNDLPLKVDFTNDRIVIYLSKKDDTILLDDMIIPDTKNIIYFSSNLSDEIHKMSLNSLLTQIDFSPQEKEKIRELDKKNRLKKKNSDTKKYYLVESVFE